MPVIKTIRESMVGNDVSSVKTIINGTCNYILTRMTARALPFEDALKEAQAQGYAEADPELDVGGGDSGHKVAIIASLLHSGFIPFSDVSVEGISRLTPEDIEYAGELGYVIKLLGIIERDRTPRLQIELRVHPAMLRREHILASVSDAFNAVLLRGSKVGDILLYGKGAGELPTASAVMSDIADAARNILGGTPRRLSMDYYCESKRLPVKSLDAARIAILPALLRRRPARRPRGHRVHLRQALDLDSLRRAARGRRRPEHPRHLRDPRGGRGEPPRRPGRDNGHGFRRRGSRVIRIEDSASFRYSGFDS